MLDPNDIDRIRESFNFLLPLQEDAAEAFYHELFERYPDVRDMFPEDMSEQTGKLWSVLVTAVESLDDFEALRPTLRNLGQSHVGYGVAPAHYDAVAEVLIDTVAYAMGPEFGERHRSAWSTVLGAVSSEMIGASTKAA